MSSYSQVLTQVLIQLSAQELCHGPHKATILFPIFLLLSFESRSAALRTAALLVVGKRGSCQGAR